jgi:hypothetical protein
MTKQTTRTPAILVFTDSVIVSTDALVSHDTAAALFGIKPSSLRRNWRKISARHGLQRVRTGGTWKYRLKSIEAVIKRCAERDEPLYETDETHPREVFLKQSNKP